MNAFALLAAGFFLSLASYSLAGEFSFLGLAALVGLALFLLFFIDGKGRMAWFIGGTCLAMESLGLSHFGLASALGLILILLHDTLGLRLNFTSRFIRYMIALALAFLTYVVLLFPLSGALPRLVSLLPLYLLIGLLAFYVSSIRQKPTYELV